MDLTEKQSFSDDDLKLLKKWCEYECFLSTDIKEIRKLLPGLLSRLEAAESERAKFEAALTVIRQCAGWCECSEMAREALNTKDGWRKTCGK